MRESLIWDCRRDLSPDQIARSHVRAVGSGRVKCPTPSEAPPQTKLIVSKRSPRSVVPPSYRRLANRILDPARPEEENLTGLHHVPEVEDSSRTWAFPPLSSPSNP